MWANIVAALREFLGLRQDIDTIMKPFVKVQNGLTTFAERQKAKAAAEHAEAERLRKEATDRINEAARASKLAQGVGSLL